MFNLCIREGVYPKSLKSALDVPINEGGTMAVIGCRSMPKSCFLKGAHAKNRLYLIFQ